MHNTEGTTEIEQVRTSQEILWQGMIYEVDAQAVYKDGGHIRLPDGSLIKVEKWNITTVPPKILALVIAGKLASLTKAHVATLRT